MNVSRVSKPVLIPYAEWGKSLMLILLVTKRLIKFVPNLN